MTLADKKATIVHISAFPYPGAGGVERRLVEYLAKVDDEFQHVLCAIDPSDDMEEALRALPVQTFILRRRFRFDARLVLKLVKILREVSPDVVHSRGFTGFLWGGLASLMSRRTKFVRGEHGSIVFQSPMHKLVDWLLTRRCNALIANSNAVKTELVRKLRFPADGIHVVHNGIDVEQFIEECNSDGVRETLDIDADAPVVGTVGNFHPWKDQQTLVRSIPKVLESHPAAVFVMVGEGSQLESCRNLAIKIGVDASVRFTGGQDNPAPYYALFDVFALPSIYESFGNVLVEAGLAGKPSVANRAGGIQEVLEDGVTGILIEPTVSLADSAGTANMPQNLIDLKTGMEVEPMSLNPDELAAEIVLLLNDNGRATSMGMAAQTRAKEEFSLRKYSDRLAKIYRNLASSN